MLLYPNIKKRAFALFFVYIVLVSGEKDLVEDRRQKIR